MSKKSFLRKLGNKLELLKEEEKKDIIEEYRGHIDLKISNGKSEEDAVADFGDIDELVTEILDAYKIKNPKNNDNESKFEGYVNDFVDTAKDIFKNMAESINEDTLGFIFKIIIVLLVIGLLKIPFFIIENIGAGIFRTLTFGFMDNFLVWIWRVVVQLGYVIAAILFGFAIFKKNGKIKDVSKEIKKGLGVKENKKDSKKRKEEKSVEKEIIAEEKLEPVIKKSSTGVINSTFIFFIKFIVILFCIPFVMTQIGFVITFGGLIMLAIEGVVMWGLIAIFLGLISLTGVIISFIYNVIFRPEKIKLGLVAKLIISFLFIGFGSVALVFDVMGFDYIDESPSHNYEFTTEVQSYEINEEIIFNYDFGNIEVIESDEIINGIVIEANYIGELINVEFSKINNLINVEIDDEDYYFNEVKDIYDIIMIDLKADEIHNYTKLFTPSYTIYISSENRNNLKIEQK